MSKIVQNTIPVFPVADLTASIRFYTEILEWKLDWSGGKICSVSRDGSHLMLSALIPVASPAWVWISLASDQLFQIYQDRGVTVVQAPQNWNWGYEMKLADPDGNILWLATAPRSDFPFATEPPPASPA